MAMIAEENAPISYCRALLAKFAAFSLNCGEFNSAPQPPAPLRGSVA
jgi:hypothetical protein